MLFIIYVVIFLHLVTKIMDINNYDNDAQYESYNWASSNNLHTNNIPIIESPKLKHEYSKSLSNSSSPTPQQMTAMTS